jgi:protein-S-isoprenylcysteine O-methyltransferase Ste14
LVNPTAERALNWAFGLSVLGWTIAGFAADVRESQISSARLVICALNLSVAWLFLTRSPTRKGGSAAQIAVSLPALLVAGWAARATVPLFQWPTSAQIVFAAGGALAIVSLISLGRSFAILPALRRVVVRGPYAWVRHPAFLGELTMILACCIADAGALRFLPIVVAVPLVAVRILAEEKVLTTSDAYPDYARKVRWRLIPGVW